MKNIVTLAVAMLWAVAAFADGTADKRTYRIESGKNERWWGGYSQLGHRMPFDVATGGDLSTDNKSNQSAPFLVSSDGRYIWSDTPFRFTADRRGITVESSVPVSARSGGKSLREAFLIAAQRHFKSKGKSPASEMFSAPQYNTWIELGYDQSQQGVLDYAQALLDNGFPAGVIMIDDNWHRHHGSLSFDMERFPDPKQMVDRLHEMGFKVMLWVSPFVTPDSPLCKDLASKRMLIRDRDGRPAVISWWNGRSACYDFTNPAACDYYKEGLRSLQERYGIDGFKFDGGDTYFYTGDIVSFDEEATPVDHLQAWSRIGLDFPFNEYRASYGLAGEPLAERLSDKNCTWDDLGKLVPDMIAAGLLGYPYACPDMIGGGELTSFSDNADIDGMMVVRSAQVHALMPMMQFSVAPWRVLGGAELEACRKAAALHVKMAPYIATLVREAEQTGAPIVRAMEYEFPKRGFADCKDQFMLGSRYLVAPIVTPSSTREVRLPAGRWRDDMGTLYKGPLVLDVTVSPDRLLYFERIK